MKQNFYLSSLIFFSLFSFSLMANSTWVSVTNNAKTTPEINVVKSNESETVLTFDVYGFTLKEVETPNGVQNIVLIPEGTSILKAGAPDLPKLTQSIVIHDQAKMDLELVANDYVDYENVEIAPSKGNFTRDILPSDVEMIYGPAYNQNAFFPSNIIEARKPYILRDYRGQTIIVNPFQYNPVTKVLRVHNSVTVKTTPTKEMGTNPILNPKNRSNSEFNNIYASQFANYNNMQRYTPVADDGTMLIICHDDFLDDMTDFIAWKRQRGLQVEMVAISEIGNNAAVIKSFVQNKYDNGNLSFLLLVGDAEFITPDWSTYGNGDSDVMYGMLAGDDHYPEVFVGRFSGETREHIQTHVAKVIQYERDVTTNDTSYGNAALIASNEGAGNGDDGEADYEHAQNMAADMLNFTYDYTYEFYDGSQGGNDAPGYPTADMVVDALESGISVMTYTGHGSEAGCATSGISSNDVMNMSNPGKLAYFWSVACVNGDFVGKTCFAEAWMRATHNGEPSGAIATLMASINQSWAPPMSGQDEMVDILTESYQDNIRRSFGGISYNGCMQMMDDYNAIDMMDTWNCFGDPSFYVRTDTPVEIMVNHDDVIFLGGEQLSVTTSIPDALIAATIDGEIITVEKAENGMAMLSFPPLSNVGFMKITVTGFNGIPYQGDVEIVPASGPFVNVQGHDVIDVTGNNNSQADYNEIFDWTINIQNVGIAATSDLTVELVTSDEYVTINTGAQQVGGIDAGNGDVPVIFQLTTDTYVPDLHNAIFELVVTDDAGNTWTSTPTLSIHAPKPSILEMSIDDAAYGNNNGRMDLGERVVWNIEILNDGTSATPASTLTNLVCNNSHISIANKEQNTDMIAAGESYTLSYDVLVSPTAPLGTMLNIDLNWLAGMYQTEKSFERQAGLIVDDYESNDFTYFDWDTNGGADWIIDNVIYFEGGASAKSGNIEDDESSTLELNINTIEDGFVRFHKKVSTEGGWDFFRFYIDGTQMGEWSGEEEWSEEEYYILAGNHTLTWTYEKDYIISSGEDCAWVDFVSVPRTIDQTSSCSAELGNLNLSDTEVITNELFTATSSGNNSNFTQTYILTDTDYTIVAINETGEFSTSVAGTFYVFAINHDTDTNLPSVGQNAFDVNGGCFDVNFSTDNAKIIIVSYPTSITDLANSISIYPNPVDEILTIEAPKQAISYEIYDAAGKLSLSNSISNFATIDLSGLSAGVYLLQINTTEGISAHRIIKR